MTRWRWAGLLALLILVGQTAAAPTSVVDDLGHHLSTQPTATRIVTLAPSATELVLAAGAGSKLVAASSSDGISLPRGVPKLYAFGGLDRERLLQLHPNLVIAWASGNRASDLAWLRSIGIRVYTTEPKRLADIARAIRNIGALAGTSRTANHAANTFEQAVRSACPHSRPAQSVYVDIWDRPALTVGGRHWLNRVLQHANLRNIYQHIDKGVFPIEAEARMAQPAARIVHLDRHDRLARLLGRPGPELPQAIAALCRNSAQPAPGDKPVSR